jgi:guanylate kinase
MTAQTQSTEYGTLLVLSGPSGAGKTTLYKQFLHENSDFAFHFSVSCTTRAPREGEADGEDYYFLSETAFKEKIEKGAFLEWALVHGNYYGTLRSEVKERVLGGQNVLLDIDIEGARQVREQTINTFLSSVLCDVFVAPPSLSVLEARLRGRQTDTEDVITTRLKNARHEMAAWRDYSYLITSDNVAEAVDQLRCILVAAKCRTERMPEAPWSDTNR